MMKHLSILALVATVLFSCSKKNNNKQSTPDPMDKLNAQEKELIGSWIFEKAIDSSYNGTAKDVTMQCQTDDVFNFRVDKMYTKDAGALDSCGKSHGDYGWGITENGFDFVDGPATLTLNRYIKIDATHFAAQGRWPGAGSLTYFYRKL